MKPYTSVLQTYYDASPEHVKDLIDFLAPVNLKCNKETFEYLLNNKITNGSKASFVRNGYAYGMYNKKPNEKKITRIELNHLDKSIKTLDGTLLGDVVARWLYEHDIFA